MRARLRIRQFLGFLGSGLIALFPAAMTIWIISAVVRWLAEVFGPHSLLGLLMRPKDGSDASHFLIMTAVYLVALLLIVLLGYSTHKRARTWIMDLVNLLFGRFPLVNRVYGALQQVANVMRSQAGDEAKAMTRFGDVVYVRYANLQILALLTSRRIYRIDGVPHLQVFLPHSPMPATGLLFFAPLDDVILTELDIEAYTKIEVSFGSLTSQTVPRGMKTWRLRLEGGTAEADVPPPDAEVEPKPEGTEKPKRPRRPRKVAKPEARVQGEVATPEAEPEA